MPYSLPKDPSRRFQASAEGVGFGPPSHVRVCDSRVDVSRVEKRQGCGFSQTVFGYVHAHPPTLSNVNPSVFALRSFKTFTI